MLACLLALLVVVPPQGRALGAEERSAFRAHFTEALAAQDALERERLVERARERFGDRRFAELLAALREGPLLAPDALAPRRRGAGLEELIPFGRTRVGYLFEHRGELFRYAIDLPEAYDPTRPAPLLLDPGHGSAQGSDDEVRADMLSMYRRHADRAGLAHWILVRTEIVEQIGVGGVRGARPEDEVAAVFQSCLRDLATRVRLDPDQIRLTGVSQTGFWAWVLGIARADRFAGLAPMSSITRLQVDPWLGNLLHLPVHVLHGSEDDVTEVVQVRATMAQMAALGLLHRYREIEGAGHDYGVWGQQPEALGWLATLPRQRHPRSLSKSLQTLSDPWAHWIRVDALERVGSGRAASPPTGGVDAEIEGQEVRIFTEGIQRLTLFLASELLDLDRPVEVRWNGVRVHSGRLRRDLGVLLGAAAEKADWSATFEASIPLELPASAR